MRGRKLCACVFALLAVAVQVRQRLQISFGIGGGEMGKSVLGRVSSARPPRLDRTKVDRISLPSPQAPVLLCPTPVAQSVAVTLSAAVTARKRILSRSWRWPRLSVDLNLARLSTPCISMTCSPLIAVTAARSSSLRLYHSFLSYRSRSFPGEPPFTLYADPSPWSS